ncbi:hypothetical protein K2173_017014 [Erythroxylum novogranatense]|uniref:Remorin C-terminal domain-containing protein n=1 Tax=Erythroxylum novogranatense TaxID=1862640 RepID=A0AAV8U5N3_9ROSI|nr:hypothetical protein K2173_017014 [Erythroxylum novogranatense]
MEYLIKQTRGKYSGRGTPEESGSIWDRRIPIQKTVPFKEEKKRPQFWFRRQVSRQMSRNYDLDEIEKATAVAAAAYVIASLNESAIPAQKVSQGPDASLDQVKSKEEATKTSTSKRLSGAGSMRNQETPDNEAQDITVKIDGPVPSLKKTPTSTSKPALSTERIPTSSENDLKSRKVEPKKEVPTRRPEISVSKPDMPSKKPENAVPEPDLPSTSKPIGRTVEQTPTKPGKGDLNADAWEKAELAKVKKRYLFILMRVIELYQNCQNIRNSFYVVMKTWQVSRLNAMRYILLLLLFFTNEDNLRYEEVNAQILSWENRKRTKARQKLDRTESEIEGMKLKSLEKFSSRMEAVTQIAQAARATAAEKERKEALKVKEKANVIRKTGKFPRTCFCF